MKYSAERQVVWISCADDKGIIHRVTGALLGHGANLIETDEFVDTGTSLFFMRVEFTGPVGGTEVLNEIRALLPEGPAQVEIRSPMPKRLVILATRELHCLGDLLLRHYSGVLPAKILAVVSQYEGVGDLARRFDIPFHHVPVGALGREEHEAELSRVIVPYDPEYLVLAKYMRILSQGFVAQFRNRIVNIHHSFLPAFIGANPYAQAHERGVKIIGATSHFVNENLDDGPIITQSVIPVTHALDPAEMSRQGRDVERVTLAQALRLVLEDRVLVHGNRTIVFE